MLCRSANTKQKESKAKRANATPQALPPPCKPGCAEIPLHQASHGDVTGRASTLASPGDLQGNGLFPVEKGGFFHKIISLCQLSGLPEETIRLKKLPSQKSKV